MYTLTGKSPMQSIT